MKHEFEHIDWEWVQGHMKDDPKKLSLKFGREKLCEIEQIECRQRTSKKLYQTLQNPHFIFPSILLSSQSTSDDLAAFHGSLFKGDDKVLDMTSGLAIDSFQIAKNAKHVTAIDMSEEAVKAAEMNAQGLGLENIVFVWGDSVEWLKNHDGTFDTIYIDPARRDSNNRKCYSLADCIPDITVLTTLLLAKAKKILIKASPMLDISNIEKTLPGVGKIYALGTATECKELLIELSSKAVGEKSRPRLFAVTVSGEEAAVFEFPWEKTYATSYSNPSVGGYIYLPYPSLMKIDNIGYIAEQFNLQSLGQNVNLLYADSLMDNFSGNAFRIVEIVPFTKQNIKSLRLKYPKLNITTKNFPLKSEKLAEILKVNQGGDKRMFAITTHEGKRVLIVTEG